MEPFNGEYLTIYATTVKTSIFKLNYGNNTNESELTNFVIN